MPTESTNGSSTNGTSTHGSVGGSTAALADQLRTPADGAQVQEVAQQFSVLARLLESEHDTSAMLDQLVASAIAVIPGVDEGSISMVTGRTLVEAQHPSSDLPKRVDAIQTETGQGPCLSAVYEQQTVRSADLEHETRWPEFVARAFAEGAGAMLSFQLYVSDDNLGALNLYSRTPGAFDEESEQIGLLFASHAAVRSPTPASSTPWRGRSRLVT